MQRCCGITKKSEQCKRHTYSKNLNYGIELHACNVHKNQNMILEWSKRGHENKDTPVRIKNYLDMFWSLSENLNFMRSVPLVMITTHTFLEDTKKDTTDALSIREKFYEDVFKESSVEDECPVCFDVSQEISTPCNHGFCKSCIYQWCDMRGTCPMCRQQFLKIF